MWRRLAGEIELPAHPARVRDIAPARQVAIHQVV